MELEQWLRKYNVKEMVMRDLNFYLSEYKKEDEEDFKDFFRNVVFENIKYEFHSVSYVINTWHATENEQRKYISAKVRLEYEETTFAEYEAIYNLQGEGEDDYLRLV
ncbi:hypothetical protein [Clostridium felsineum]|uniref:Uncharacterized protein n=1 Tax=Clostridium felsineum TaxID=36839 RepID=A0A1S8KZJ7_9CLOT|nr:hypothetical protein [Clostridium felsineum]URZ06759.1 hypothetical protein CLROS_020920 [Clostridium felsineum]URZ11791.1 hypothetical protein CROST_025080 [Clostridium felsineum]URZ16353.1 hypothetical protein CLFE_024000 [Clostridium felsineum DSM 794]